MKTYIIKCTRCDGTGHFAGHGTCFKCNGTGQNEVNEKQYKEYKSYSKKKDDASSYVMFNKATGAISNLLDKDITRSKFESISIAFGGKNIPVAKVELDNENYIAIKFSHDWKPFITQLVKVHNKKLGIELTDEQAKEIVNNY